MVVERVIVSKLWQLLVKAMVADDGSTDGLGFFCLFFFSLLNKEEVMVMAVLTNGLIFSLLYSIYFVCVFL